MPTLSVLTFVHPNMPPAYLITHPSPSLPPSRLGLPYGSASASLGSSFPWAPPRLQLSSPCLQHSFLPASNSLLPASTSQRLWHSSPQLPLGCFTLASNFPRPVASVLTRTPGPPASLSPARPPKTPDTRNATTAFPGAPPALHCFPLPSHCFPLPCYAGAPPALHCFPLPSHCFPLPCYVGAPPALRGR